MHTQGCERRSGIHLPHRVAGLALAVSAVALAGPRPVQGDIVTVQVTGTVTKVERTNPNRLDLDGSVVIGSPYHLTFVIDTDAADMDPDPGRGVYLIKSGSGELGNYTWSKTQPPVFGIEVDDGPQNSAFDEYELGVHDFEFNENFLIDGTPTLLSKNAFDFVLAKIVLADMSTSMLNSDALVLPVLDGWGFTGFSMQLMSDENAVGFRERIFIDGTIDSITIPEPGVAIMAGLLLAISTITRQDY